MLRIKIVFILMVFLLGACKKNEQSDIDYVVMVTEAHLNSIEKKRVFLEQIFEDDQKVRSEEELNQIISNFGDDSQERFDYTNRQIKQDNINLLKIEAYFAEYGHPKKKEVGEIAAIAPWAVIHHAVYDDVRFRNFKILYNAYLSGDIEKGNFSMFLDRFYINQKRERLDMGSAYKEEDKIMRIIKELELSTE